MSPAPRHVAGSARALLEVAGFASPPLPRVPDVARLAKQAAVHPAALAVLRRLASETWPSGTPMLALDDIEPGLGERVSSSPGPATPTPTPRIPHPPVETSTGAPSHTPSENPDRCTGFREPCGAVAKYAVRYGSHESEVYGACDAHLVDLVKFSSTKPTVTRLPHTPGGFPGPWCCLLSCNAPAVFEIRDGTGPDDWTHACEQHVEDMGGRRKGVSVTRLEADPSRLECPRCELVRASRQGILCQDCNRKYAEPSAPNRDRWPDVQSAVDVFRELAREAGVSCDMAVDAVLAHFNPFPPRKERDPVPPPAPKEREVFCKCQRRMHRLGEGWSCDSGCGGYLTGREADEGKWQEKTVPDAVVAAMCAATEISREDVGGNFKNFMDERVKKAEAAIRDRLEAGVYYTPKPPPVITASFALGVLEQARENGGVTRDIRARLGDLVANLLRNDP